MLAVNFSGDCAEVSNSWRRLSAAACTCRLCSAAARGFLRHLLSACSVSLGGLSARRWYITTSYSDPSPASIVRSHSSGHSQHDCLPTHHPKTPESTLLIPRIQNAHRPRRQPPYILTRARLTHPGNPEGEWQQGRVGEVWLPSADIQFHSVGWTSCTEADLGSGRSRRPSTRAPR